jgi:hypothetical protein
MPYQGNHAGEPDLVAWIGEDEFGSGKIGIKQGLVPAGAIPIVAVLDDKHKIAGQHVVTQMQLQADVHKKVIRLVRYEAVEELIVVTPRIEHAPAQRR